MFEKFIPNLAANRPVVGLDVTNKSDGRFLRTMQIFYVHLSKSIVLHFGFVLFSKYVRTSHILLANITLRRRFCSIAAQACVFRAIIRKFTNRRIKIRIIFPLADKSKLQRSRLPRGCCKLCLPPAGYTHLLCSC